MQRSAASLFAFLLLALAVSPAQSADYDPAARAAAIAPYLDEQAFAVVHVDLARVDLAEGRKYIEAKLASLSRDEKLDLQRTEASASAWLKAWRSAGVEEAYIVASLSDTPRRPPFIVVPLQKKADAKAIGELAFPKPPGAPAGGAPEAPYGWEVIRGQLCLGHHEALGRLRDMKPAEHPDLAQAFKAAGDTAMQAVLLQTNDTRRVLEQTLPALPGPLSDFKGRDVAAVDFAAVGINLPPKPSIKIELRAKDAESAARLRKLASTALALGKEEPEIAKAVPKYEELITLLTPVQKDNGLTLSLNQENDGVPQALALLIPPLQASRQAAQRMQGSNNLKQLALAMHIYHETHHTFPAQHTAKAGKPLLSWRVAILPYIEQKELYDQFHHDEPWDSEHNKTLIAKMPKLFAPPGMKVEEGHTTYLVPSGKGMVFDGAEATSFSKITDGTSNTIIIVEANAASAVPWTKPMDLTVDHDNPLKGLADARELGFLTAFADGSVKFLSKSIDPKMLRYLFEMADGMNVLQD